MVRLSSVKIALLSAACAASFAALLAGCGGGGHKPLGLFATPAIFPAFNPSITDYVTRCPHGGATVRVTGPSGAQVTVDRQPDDVGKQVTVPLAVGQRYAVTVSQGSATTTYSVRCLPPDFPRWTVQRFRGAAPMWYVITPRQWPQAHVAPPKNYYVAILDSHGVPLWWMRPRRAPINASAVADGRLAWTQTTGGSFNYKPGFTFDVHTLDGSKVKSFGAVGTTVDEHEFQILPGHRYLVLSYRPQPGVDLRSIGGPSYGTVFEPEVQIVNGDGTLFWDWRADGRIPLSDVRLSKVPIERDPLPDGTVAYDAYHVNAADVRGNTVAISCYHTNSVYAIDRRSGDVVWKLGGTTTAESLHVVGDPLGKNPLVAPHDVRFWPDGTLSVYDNGGGAGRPPRVVRYRIDLARRTATLVQTFHDPTANGSVCCGSAKRIGANWVVSWGNTGVFGEYGASGRPLFRVRFRRGFFSYRVDAASRATFSAAAIRAVMDRTHGVPAAR